MSRPGPNTSPAISSSDLTRLAGGLVLLMVAAVAALTIAFWRSAAASRARAWSAAEQVAHSFNQSFQVRARTRLSESISRLFALGAGDLESRAGPALAALVAARYQASPPCACSNLGPRFAFLVEPATGRLLLAGDTTGRPARGRVTAIGSGTLALPADSSRVYVLAGEPARPWLIYYRAIKLGNGNRAAWGFEIPVEALDTAVLAPALAAVRRARWGTAPFGDSVFAVEAVLHDSLVFASQPRAIGGPSVTGRYPDGFQFLNTRVSLNPAALHHVLPGGLPEVPRAALLSLLALAGLLGAAALYLLRRARALVALREEFASTVSHELRTPLTQILLFSEMLALERGDADARRRAGGIIVRETRRLIHLVENVLVFARGRRPGVQLALAVHDLAALTTVVVQDAAALAAKFEATLHGDIAAGIAAEVDPDAWRQVVLNLVDNALRYGPAGQQVRIGLRAEGEHAVLWIDDQGPGVPAEDRDRIWRPFERLRHETQRPGTGIGLAIVAQLLALLRGTASVEDAPGGGARFVVRLPLIAALGGPSSGTQQQAGTWPQS